ncbi:unnamed protein product [Adineta ricciae]|uniref:F-box domain-containing protein n=1 Tax=Adineta ricciae TaxID=249248 RepID=A0A813Y9A6_ADIRI|nr:unnamed protein product [Adineta ricciae]
MSTARERYLEWKNRCLLPQLPTEIWVHIFSYLHVNDLLSVRRVSRLFCSCINQHTYFWSSVIFDIDQCANYSIPTNLLRHVRSANIELFTKSNIYSHCTVYLKPQPIINSTSKRRKRHLLKAHDDDDEQLKKQSYLRCASVHFETLRSFDQLQLEYLLKNRIRRLQFSYECLSHEPSPIFLFKLERLKHLKISFVHNIIQLDSFAVMLINTIRDIVDLLLKLKNLKSLTLHNLYLIQSFPENNYAINRLRSIWFENCVNIHFLLSAIDKQYLKTIVVRQSTCDRAVLTTFLDQLETLHYLDLTSLEILQSTNQNDEPLRIPVKLKTCSLNSTLLQNCSFRLASSLRSLELIDINVNQLTNIFKFCQKLRILCLFFITQQLSLSSMIRYFRKHHHRQRLIHFHVSSTTDFDDEKQILPANILIIPTQESARCFCYENLLE